MLSVTMILNWTTIVSKAWGKLPTRLLASECRDRIRSCIAGVDSTGVLRNLQGDSENSGQN